MPMTTNHHNSEKISKKSFRFLRKVSTPLAGKISVKKSAPSLLKSNILSESPPRITPREMRNHLPAIEPLRIESDDVKNISSVASQVQIVDDRPTTCGTEFVKFKSGSLASINDRTNSAKVNSMFDSKTSNFHHLGSISSFNPCLTEENKADIKIDFDLQYQHLEHLDGQDKRFQMNRASLAKFIGKQGEQLEINKLKLSGHELKVLSEYEKNLMGAKNPSSIVTIVVLNIKNNFLETFTTAYSTKTLKNMIHLNRIKDNIVINKKKKILIELMQNRKNLKSYLSLHQLNETIGGNDSLIFNIIFLKKLRINGITYNQY